MGSGAQTVRSAVTTTVSTRPVTASHLDASSDAWKAGEDYISLLRIDFVNLFLLKY